MRFIQAWSYSCANGLMQKLDENHEKRRVYYYGFQIIIGGIVKVVMLTAIAFVLGALYSTLLILAFFASLRLIAGGYHMNTYGKCITTSLFIFIFAGVIVEYTGSLWSLGSLGALIGLTFILGLYVIIRWAPSDTPNRPITKPEERRKFKMLSLGHIFTWFVVMCVLLYFGKTLYVLAGCFGILISLFIVSPVGYAFFERLSGKIDSVK